MIQVQVIIPAAGESKRFRQKGINLPKPLIQFSWQDHSKRTMIEHALWGVEHLPIHIGILKKHEDKFEEAFFNQPYSIKLLESSSGQANTVFHIVSKLKTDAPILILNSDSMFLYPLNTFLDQVQNFAAGAMVFEGEYNPIYSYADNYPLFEKTVEKDPISPWAFAGAFYFRSVNDFLKAYKKYNSATTGEQYLSEVYNFLPGKKLAVYIPKEQWICWGTAEELMADEYVNDLEF